MIPLDHYYGVYLLSFLHAAARGQIIIYKTSYTHNNGALNTMIVFWIQDV